VKDDGFVGRSAELAQLEALVTALGSGVGGVVLVEGEQGIGKSALLRAGLSGAAAVSGCQVLWGVADELGQRFPLRLLADCLGGAGDSGLGLASPGAAHGVGVLAGDPVLGAVEGILAEVDRRCAQSPVILVAEDLHWADEASVLVWHRLSRAVGQLPLLLAASCRPGTGREDLGRLRRGLAARGANLMELGPLADAEVNDLVGHLAGGRPGQQLAGLVSRAGGNPLYVRELADGLVRDHRVAVHQGVAELSESSALVRVRVPDSLAAAIGERLGWLPDDAAAVLRWAAVLGQEFSVTDLQVVTGRTAGELMGVIEQASAAGVVAEASPRLRFRHGLIRQVLYEGMPLALRAALHLQAARALAEAGAAPERVAAQLAVVPGPADDWVVGWLAGAARVLVYRAPQVAADLLHGVVGQLPDSDPRRDELEASLVTVAFLLLRHDEVEQTGRRLMARAGDADRAAEMAWLVGYTFMRDGRAAEAATVVGEGLARPGISEIQSVRLAALRAMVLTVLGELDEAARVAHQARADAARAGDRIAAGYALHALSSVSFASGNNAARLDYVTQGLAEIGDDPEAVDLRLLLLCNRAFELMELGYRRQDEALESLRRAQRLAEQTGTPRLGMIRNGLGQFFLEIGQWDDAIAELEPALRLPSPTYYGISLHGTFALIAVHRDDRVTLRRNLEAIQDQALLNVSFWSNANNLLLARALAAEQDGRPGDGAVILAQCLRQDVAEQMPSRFLLLPTLVRLALAGPDADTAAAATAAAELDARRVPPRPGAAQAADHCRGLLTGDAAPVLAVAKFYEDWGRPLDQAVALEDAATLAAAAGDRAAARLALASALRLYLALGAQWDISRARVRLRRYGVRRGPSSYKPHPDTGWEALTPTEVKVAHLVATGASNPDVAAALFLSRNTVQTHVSHILAKLGARSRAEIIRQALDHPASQSA
jgi:DNA-binding CsgD family transcriptional regulator/tetratricopeptide (TPR) repeat protein